MGETEKRDEMVKGLHEEAQLQIVLLQHQVWRYLIRVTNQITMTKTMTMTMTKTRPAAMRR